MARPKRSEQKASVEAQLKQALFDCILEKDFAETRVSDITDTVGCNRGTFYYYFKDLYELRDTVIDDNLPRDLPAMIFNIFLSQQDANQRPDYAVQPALLSPSDTESELFENYMKEGILANSTKIDACALLLNSDIGDIVSKRIEGQAIEIWCSLLGLKEEELDLNMRIIMEFLIGGLLKVLAFRAQTGIQDDIFETLRPLTPEIPIALFSCLEKPFAMSPK